MCDSLELLLPVELMRPRAVAALPAREGAYQFSIKVDGWRGAVAVTAQGVRIHSRQGRDITRQFPEVARAAASMETGTVVDGELVVWDTDAERFDFTAVQSRGLRTQPALTDPPVIFLAFDLLALPGRNLRPRPLTERWPLLEETVSKAGDEVQLILATSDVDTARAWMRELKPMAVEGIVAKPWHRANAPRSVSARWLKIRTADTLDVTVIGLIGPRRRPWAAVVQLPDGSRAVTSPRLTSVASQQLGRAVGEEIGTPVRDAELKATWHPLTHPLTAEVRVQTDRQHTLIRYVRLRADT